MSTKKTSCRGQCSRRSAGQVFVVVVQCSPEAPIAGDYRGEGGRGGSIADETITDGARTTTTMERGMCR